MKPEDITRETPIGEVYNAISRGEFTTAELVIQSMRLVEKMDGTFKLGTKVTICTDAAFKRPRRTGFVKRIGKGAWRLNGCSEWYDFEGSRVSVDCERDAFKEYIHTTCFARPYQEGDEGRIAIEDRRVATRNTLIRNKEKAEQKVRDTRANWQYSSRRAQQHAADMAHALERAEFALKQARAAEASAKQDSIEFEAQVRAGLVEIERATEALDAFDAM